MKFDLHPGKILWLASYPKSGNTWFRAFLTSLINEGEIEINKMQQDGIFSDRLLFDAFSDLESRDLYEEEAKVMIADVYRLAAAWAKKLLVLKVHDAFETDVDGNNIIPEDVTHKAIYLVRNPLDVVGSFANHNNSSIEDAITLLNNPSGCLARQPGNLNVNPQFRQNLHDWSTHVKSWIDKPSFEVLVIRYEDMLTSPFETFRKAVDFIGTDATDQQVQAAIEQTSFEKLSRQEEEKGFHEKHRLSRVFFRAGKMGNWEEELTSDQAAVVISKHSETMHRLGYLRS